MKKTLILSSILICLTFGAYAQSASTTPTFSVGGTLGVTTSDQSSTYPVAGSLILKYELPVGNSGVRIAFITGYSYYVSGDGYSTGYYYDLYGSESYSSGSIASFLPIEIGVKYYLSKGLFIEGDGGVSFYLNSDYGSNVAPVVAPWIGYTIPLGRTKFSLDLGLGYETRIESGNEFSQVAGHLAFNIGL